MNIAKPPNTSTADSDTRRWLFQVWDRLNALASFSDLTWGALRGTLSDQTDLQAALDGKQAAGTYATGTGSAFGSNTGDNAVNSLYSGLATSKQDTLVSGTNIKTINGSSVLGSGDLVVSGSAAWGSVTGTLSSQTDLQAELDAKQDDLVSGTNIKTINGASVLGSGNLSTAPAWGSVTGTLSSQADLQSALDAKQPLDAQLTDLAGLAYTGNSLKLVRVNAAETAFELATVSGGSGLTASQVSARVMMRC